MSLNTRDDQAKKPKATAPQARAHFLPADQSKASEEARKERKQTRWGRWGHKEASHAKNQEDVSETNASEINAFEANASQAGEAQKEAQKEAPKRRRWNGPSRRDASKVICYNCNKKGHYAKYCTKPKD